MTAPLSADQLNAIAAHDAALATRIGSYLGDADGQLGDRVERQLEDKQRCLEEDAATLAVRAAKTAFADAEHAFGQISSAQTEANVVAARLTHVANDVTKMVAIAAASVDLGAALASGNALQVGTKIAALVTATKTQA